MLVVPTNASSMQIVYTGTETVYDIFGRKVERYVDRYYDFDYEKLGYSHVVINKKNQVNHQYRYNFLNKGESVHFFKKSILDSSSMRYPHLKNFFKDIFVYTYVICQKETNRCEFTSEKINILAVEKDFLKTFSSGIPLEISYPDSISAADFIEKKGEVDFIIKVSCYIRELSKEKIEGFVEDYKLLLDLSGVNLGCYDSDNMWHEGTLGFVNKYKICSVLRMIRSEFQYIHGSNDIIVSYDMPTRSECKGERNDIDLEKINEDEKVIYIYNYPYGGQKIYDIDPIPFLKSFGVNPVNSYMSNHKENFQKNVSKMLSVDIDNYFVKAGFSIINNDNIKEYLRDNNIDLQKYNLDNIESIITNSYNQRSSSPVFNNGYNTYIKIQSLKDEVISVVDFKKISSDLEIMVKNGNSEKEDFIKKLCIDIRKEKSFFDVFHLNCDIPLHNYLKNYISN